MKLQILIPTYKETFDEVKPMLDSIAIQQAVDFSEIGVLMVNDGGYPFNDETISKIQNAYPFFFEYYIEEHNGVSATRNSCLRKAVADYVMFCDADDMFFNACGLYIIFNEIDNNGGFDTLMSAFVEESRMPENKAVVYITHQQDSTFVHGKVHNRQYLLDNDIWWKDNLTIHEDSYFNILCQKLSKNGKYCPNPFYLWKWRDNSVCRHDPLYLNKTLVNMLDSNTALINQFIDRSKRTDAEFYAVSMIYDIYYSLNCDRWWSKEGHDYLPSTEKRFKEYWNTFKPLFESIDQNTKNQIIMAIKNRMFTEGLMLERITFNDWIKHIEEEI